MEIIRLGLGKVIENHGIQFLKFCMNPVISCVSIKEFLKLILFSRSLLDHGLYCARNPLLKNIMTLPSCCSVGTPALTSRQFKEADFVFAAELFDKAAEIVSFAKGKATSKKIKDFFALCSSDAEVQLMIATLKKEVNEFALQFPMPGFDDH